MNIIEKIINDTFNSFNLNLRVSMTNKHKRKIEKLKDKLATEEMMYDALVKCSLEWCEKIRNDNR